MLRAYAGPIRAGGSGNNMLTAGKRAMHNLVDLLQKPIEYCIHPILRCFSQPSTGGNQVSCYSINVEFVSAGRSDGAIMSMVR